MRCIHHRQYSRWNKVRVSWLMLRHFQSVHTQIWWAKPESVRRSPSGFIIYPRRTNETREEHVVELEQGVAEKTCHNPLDAPRRNTHISCVELLNTVTHESMHQVHEHFEQIWYQEANSAYYCKRQACAFQPNIKLPVPDHLWRLFRRKKHVTSHWMLHTETRIFPVWNS